MGSDKRPSSKSSESTSDGRYGSSSVGNNHHSDSPEKIRPSSKSTSCSEGRLSSIGSGSRPSSVGIDLANDGQPSSQHEDELETEVQQSRLSSYDVCLEHRAILEKKFGGDIQVKLMEADNLKKIHFLEQIFEEFDADKSGQMDMHEFFVALRTCGFRVSMPAALSIMKEVDADVNGTIDLDEFIEFFKKMDDLENFRCKVETAHLSSGTRGKLLSGYVLVLFFGAFGMLLLDIENEGENFTVRVLMIILILLFFASISAVILLPLFTLKFKPDEKMADVKKHLGRSLRSLKKKRKPKHVEETFVEPVEIPLEDAIAVPSAVEASRLKHPHLYAAANQKQAHLYGTAPSEASRSEATRSVGSYRKGARSEASVHTHRSHSVASADLHGSDAQGQMGISALEKKIWEPPGAPDIEYHTRADVVTQGPDIEKGLTIITGLVDQSQHSRSLSQGYDISQYDKARELQARGLQAERQVNQGALTNSANFTPFQQSRHRPRQ